MVERRRLGDLIPHIVLLIGVAIVAFPVYLCFVGSTHPQAVIANGQMPVTPGPLFYETYYKTLFIGTSGTTREPVSNMLLNSFIMATIIAVGKIAISIISSYAVVYFRFPFRMAVFWIIFMTLMLPVEVRIVPTFKVVADLGLLNSYAGLTIPLIASATATFLFRQFFLTVPDELAEAARIDGAGPVKFMKDILLPLSRTNLAALFVIMFTFGWNQYLWPLLMTTDRQYLTVVMGIQRMINVADTDPQWPLVMAAVILAMLPPVAVVLLMQRWFIKGLVDTEK
jgi:sn-glycerol 3-phosphate transport system permease protein